MSAEALDELLDDHLKPYVAPLGALVISSSRAEMNLFQLILQIKGNGAKDALKSIDKGRDKIKDIIAFTPYFDDAQIADLSKKIDLYFIAKDKRNRFVHDDYAPGWDEDEGLVVVTVGRKRDTPENIIYREPSPAEISELALDIAVLAKSFEYYYIDWAKEYDRQHSTT